MYEIPFTRINEMADVSAEAFIACDDPVGNFIFQKEPHHFLLKKQFFGSLVTACSPNALRHAISPNLEAISIWFPPGMDHSGDADADTVSVQDFVDQRTMDKIQAVHDVIASLTVHLGYEPQWHLHLVAVRPQFRGRRYSSLLISPILKKAEKENLSCTLITHSLDNVRNYESWGFKVVREMCVPRSQEKFFSMRRN